jgi:predicted metal-dependent enzyme (double-stranded beta helix superfamily)
MTRAVAATITRQAARTGEGGRLSPAELAAIVAGAAASGAWRSLVRFTDGHRWYHRLDPAGPDAAYEIWLLSWLPGQQTGFHDHGDAAGAFAVASGALTEVTGRPGVTAVRERVLASGAVRSFGPAHLHDVRNRGVAPAVSVHAYSPPLSAMRRYELTATGLVLTGTDTAADGW